MHQTACSQTHKVKTITNGDELNQNSDMVGDVNKLSDLGRANDKS